MHAGTETLPAAGMISSGHFEGCLNCAFLSSTIPVPPGGPVQRCRCCRNLNGLLHADRSLHWFFLGIPGSESKNRREKQRTGDRTSKNQQKPWALLGTPNRRFPYPLNTL